MADDAKIIPEVIDKKARESVNEAYRAAKAATDLQVLNQSKIELLTNKLASAEDEIDSLIEKIELISTEKMQSDDLRDLYKALTAAKLSMKGKGPQRSGKGQHTKTGHGYAKLDELRSFIDEHISPHGLSFLLEPIVKDGKDFLRFTLQHDNSGQFKASISKLDSYKPGWQGYGEALSYAKRFVLCSIFAIDSGDVEVDESEQYDEPEVKAKPVQTQAVLPVKKPFNPTSF